MAIGIPALLNPIPTVSLALLTMDAPEVTAAANASSAQTEWGIFLDGTLVVEPDSVVSFEFKKDFRVPDYPMEEGGFESYNKVTTPFDARIRMVKGGTDFDRNIFLDAVNAAAESLALYDVITPSRIYSSANIVHWDYRQTASNGLGLIIVDLWLTEVRVTITPQFTNTAQPSGVSPKATGTVLPKAPTPAQETPVKKQVTEQSELNSELMSSMFVFGA